MTIALIRAGFEAALKSWADAQTPAIPVAWQNVAFTPPVGRYISFELLPAPNRYLTLDGIGRKYRGIGQVSFHMPINTGSGSVEALSASMDAAFTSMIVSGALRIYLMQPFSVAPPIIDGVRHVVPVSAPYEAHYVA